jgi:hypothetical protein
VIKIWINQQSGILNFIINQESLAAKTKAGRKQKKIPLKEDNKARGVFGSVVVFVFQSDFCSKIYQNNIFILKKSFLTSTYQNNLKTQNFKVQNLILQLYNHFFI